MSLFEHQDSLAQLGAHASVAWGPRLQDREGVDVSPQDGAQAREWAVVWKVWPLQCYQPGTLWILFQLLRRAQIEELSLC